MSPCTPRRANHFGPCEDLGDDAYCVRHSDSAGNETFVIDGDMVERAVLEKARFEVILRADGTVTLDPMGLSEAAIADARSKGVLADTDLASLCRVCLDEKILSLEDKPRTALGLLREQLATCLGLVDAAIKALP